MEKSEKILLFKDKIKKIYGDALAEKIFHELETKCLTSFRVNTLKANPNNIIEELSNQGFLIKEGAFKNSYFVEMAKESLQLSATAQFNEGKIYIQNLSSIIPAFVLDPKPKERILDICAAPGSKTSLIAALAENKAEITAVENSINRFNVLKSNLKNLGVENITFIKSQGQSLLYKNQNLEEFFDKILCDVPCSNEGLVRDLENYDFAYWNPKNSKKLSQLQKKILASAYKMLKKGGVLVYSTCTYSVEENEAVIDWALKKLKGLKLDEINLIGVSVAKGFTSYQNKKFSKTLEKTLRMLPDRNYEAFFIAKLVKTG